MPSLVRQARHASLVALVALLLVAQDALGLTWGPRVAITSSRNAAASLHAFAASSATTGHLVYEEASGGIRRIWYRRSTDGGTTWAAPVRLSASSAVLTSGATISAAGSAIDVAWLEQLSTGNYVVKYRRSASTGGSWGAEVVLSSVASSAGSVRLARDSSGRVYATWTNDATGAVSLRRSLDGGVTWQSSQGLGTTTNQPFDEGSFYDAWPVLASGTGIVYFAFASSPTSVKLRGSTDGGGTWSSAVTLASTSSGLPLDMAAAGSVVVVGFAKNSNGQLSSTIRRSTDKGASWKTAQPLAPTTGAWSWVPLLAVNGTTVRVLYERDTSLAGTRSDAWYRQSTDSGGTWSTGVKLSNTARPYSVPAGVGFTSATIVVWWDWAPDVLDSDLFVRRGS